MTMTVKQVEDIQDRIDDAKGRKAKLEGQREELEKRMKEDFGASSVDGLKETIEKKKKRKERLEEKEAEAVDALKKVLPADVLQEVFGEDEP